MRSTRTAPLSLALSLLACAGACGSDDDAGKRSRPASERPAATAAASAVSAASASASAVSAASASASAAPAETSKPLTESDFPPDADGYAPDGLPAVIPSTFSKPPTVAEWEGLKRDARVLGAPALGCQTRMLREWLRVSCRPKGDRVATSVESRKQSGQHAYAGMFGDRASVVVQVLKGKSYSAFFTWNDGTSATLQVDWPAGSPRPFATIADVGDLPSEGAGESGGDGGLPPACRACAARKFKAEGCKGKNVNDPNWDAEICARAIVRAVVECKAECPD